MRIRGAFIQTDEDERGFHQGSHDDRNIEFSLSLVAVFNNKNSLKLHSFPFLYRKPGYIWI